MLGSERSAPTTDRGGRASGADDAHRSPGAHVIPGARLARAQHP